MTDADLQALAKREGISRETWLLISQEIARRESAAVAIIANLHMQLSPELTRTEALVLAVRGYVDMLKMVDTP